VKLNEIETSILFRTLKLGKLRLLTDLEEDKDARALLLEKGSGDKQSLERADKRVEHDIFSLNTIDRIEESLKKGEAISTK